MELSALECRIVGALIEKEVTTPDQYPLSIKALTTACNQKSNREPVMDLTEEEVQTEVDELVKRNLVGEVIFGSRVTKYKHRFGVSDFSSLQLSSRERAIICVLFLRGPQTPGELRGRTQRLSNFSDVGEVEACLQAMATRESGALVKQLPREPGKRESRYIHLFSGEMPSVTSEVDCSAHSSRPEGLALAPSLSAAIARIDVLEEEVRTLRFAFDQLKGEWESFNS